MLQATFDAFIAHKEAWEKCKILHRDISGTNVMLDRWGRDALNDWDLCEKVDERNKTSRRMGTWYFMCTLLLQTPGKQHDLQDHLESFVLLVFFHTLSHLKHNMTEGLGGFIERVFETCYEERPGVYVGGAEKLVIFMNEEFIDKFEVDGNRPLSSWLKVAFGMVKEWIQEKMKPDPKDSREPLLSRYHRRKGQSLKPETVDETSLLFYDHGHLEEIFEIVLGFDLWPNEVDKYTHDFVRDETSGAGKFNGKRSAAKPDALDAPRAKRLKSVNNGMPSVEEGHEEFV